MKRARIITGFITAGVALFAQTGSHFEFEAASIKPVAPPDPFAIAADGNAAVVDPGRVELRAVSVATLIQMAWHVRAYQIVGPDWIRTSHYDLKVKVPDGGTKTQLPDMLKSLLTERFQLVVHEEQTMVPGFALAAAKSGVKLRVSTDENQESEAGRSGVAERIRPGGSGRALGSMKVKSTSGGVTTLAGTHMTTSILAATLSQLLGEPVMDETNLKGSYDVSFDLTAHDLAALTMGASGMGGALTQSARDSANASVAGNLVKMGLKLESRKVAVHKIVVDKSNSKPTEN